MFETIQKAILIGLGAADIAAERARKMIDELVERGEVSGEQGKQLYSDIMARMEERGRVENEKIRAQVREIMKDMGIPDIQRVAKIETRLDALERKIDEILSRTADESKPVK